MKRKKQQQERKESVVLVKGAYGNDWPGKKKNKTKQKNNNKCYELNSISVLGEFEKKRVAELNRAHPIYLLSAQSHQNEWEGNQ